MYKEQTEKASNETNPYDDVHDYEEHGTYPHAFIKGAEWAFEHPHIKYLEFKLQLAMDFVKSQAASECYVMCGCQSEAQSVLDKIDQCPK